MMQYLAELAGGTGMEDRVLETNPILEAFGNAKTIHNNNSSRFGKLIEIYFDRNHSICGAHIHTYLLEKSRVVHQQPGERSYHIFYQLCRGASDAERERYLLPPGPEHFNYLNGGTCTTIAGVDDAAQFAAVKAAMAAVGISEQQQDSLFAVVAAILWLGNVQFHALHDDAVAVAESSMPAVCSAAKLLECSEEDLLQALTTRRIVAGGEEIRRELSMDAALDNRDALSKAIYAALFKWLVEQTNIALAVDKQRSKTTLSILDIYGFECFQENSFEQLCINFANERLQQQFSKHMFKIEQEVYESENIDWAHVEFVDNQDCVDLIEARPPAGVGILSLLDEECMMPKGSGSTFAAKLRQCHASHSRFGYNTKAPGDDFTVNHYAGPVVYSTAKFLDKNRDTLSKDLVALLQASSLPLVQTLASEMERGIDRKGSQTVGGRFRDQLRDLIQRLDATALHFVRCIKPNSQQVPGKFDAALILHQLRCCGVLEVTRIARAGYPTRYLHTEFAERYRLLLPELGPGQLADAASVLAVCKQLLGHFAVDSSQYQIGRTRLFFRAGILGHLEEATARMLRSAILIQSTWRMVRCHREFVRARTAATAIQALWRGKSARLLFADMLLKHNAAVRIQAAAKGWKQRLRYQQALQKVVAIQMMWRQHCFNKRVAVREEVRRQAEAEQQMQAEAKRQEEQTFEAIKQDFEMDAGEIRRVLALWQEHGETFMQWRQLPKPSPSAAAPARLLPPSPSPPPPAAEDSGLLLEIAAANVDAQQSQQRLERMQSYCSKLERNLDELKEENQLLQRAVQTLQEAVDEATDPATRAHYQRVLASTFTPPKSQRAASPGSASRAPLPPRPQYAMRVDGTSAAAMRFHSAPRVDGTSAVAMRLSGPRVDGLSSAARRLTGDGRRNSGQQQMRRPSGVLLRTSATCELDDDDSISLMSMTDNDSFSESQGGVSGMSSPTPVTSSLAAAREDSSSVVSMLQREFDRKRSLFSDDADFIQEVRRGEAVAPGMDPELELQRLVARYRGWKKEFKERIESTQRVLKQLKREERRAAAHTSSTAQSAAITKQQPSSSQTSSKSKQPAPPAAPKQGKSSTAELGLTSRMLSHLHLKGRRSSG